VSQLQILTNLSQPITSQYLALLKKSNLIIKEKKSREVYYQIDERRMNIFCDFLEIDTRQNGFSDICSHLSRVKESFFITKLLLNKKRAQIIQAIIKEQPIQIKNIIKITGISQSLCTQYMQSFVKEKIAIRKKYEGVYYFEINTEFVSLFIERLTKFDLEYKK
jgi:predicted transcriptional regulator